MSAIRGTGRLEADNAAPAAGAPEAVCHEGGRRAEAAGEQAARVPLRELMDDRLLDALLERSRDEAGGLRLTGVGSMLGELVAAGLEPPDRGPLHGSPPPPRPPRLLSLLPTGL